MSDIALSRAAGEAGGVARVSRFFHYSQNNSGGSFRLDLEQA